MFKDLPSEAPGSSAPENACVKINVAMGHARYSALTKSIMLQLNELVPNSALYSPSGFKVVAGFAVNSVSRVKNASGVPKYVTLTSSAGVPVTFEFADGESVGAPLMTTENLADGRLAMADAQGWATSADPAYYDYYPGDGARWRFGAASLSPDYMQFVEHQTPEGRVETRQDLGLEIVRDAEGCLRQVATPAEPRESLSRREKV